MIRGASRILLQGWLRHASSCRTGKLIFVPSPYTLKQRIALAIVPRIASLAICCLGMTLRYRDACDPGALLPSHRSLDRSSPRPPGRRSGSAGPLRSPRPGEISSIPSIKSPQQNQPTHPATSSTTKITKVLVSDFHFDLAEDLIAQSP